MLANINRRLKERRCRFTLAGSAGAGAKCASRKKFSDQGACAFVGSLQLSEASREIRFKYDRSTSGPTIYAYVNGKPTKRIDPFGLMTEDIHRFITEDAIGNDSCLLGGGLPDLVQKVDNQRGSQSPVNAYKHCMRNGLIAETVEEARAAHMFYEAEQLTSCTMQGLANALHAAQDCHASGHAGYQPYYGLLKLTRAHVLGDIRPGSAYFAAVETSRNLISKFKNMCPCVCAGK